MRRRLHKLERSSQFQAPPSPIQEIERRALHLVSNEDLGFMKLTAMDVALGVRRILTEIESEMLAGMQPLWTWKLGKWASDPSLTQSCARDRSLLLRFRDPWRLDHFVKHRSLHIPIDVADNRPQAMSVQAVDRRQEENLFLNVRREIQ